MISMSEFVKAGGMKTLLEHAVSVKVGKVTSDPEQAENYYVDIRFRFNSAVNRPFFGEKDLQSDDCRTDTSGVPPTPRKLVSILSDDAGPMSTEVDVINPFSNDRVSPLTEGYTWESNEGQEKLEMEAPQEAVYMPDAMWIARTQALSSLLKERDVDEKTAEEATTTDVISVRGAVRAVGPRDESESNSKDGDAFMDQEFAMFSPSTEIPDIESRPLATVSEANAEDPENARFREPHQVSVDREQTLKEILNDPKAQSKLDADFFNTITAKKRSRDEKKNADDAGVCPARTAEKDQSSSVHADDTGSDEEIPKGCGLLRTSSLKAAVRTIRRSFSRERKSEKAGEDRNASASVVYSARANKTMSHTEVSTDDIKQDVVEEEDEIQPNPQPQNVKRQAEDRPDASVGQADNGQRGKAGERDAISGGNLLKKTSNLARNLLHKLSSREEKERKNRTAAAGGDGESNELGRFRKIRSLLHKRSSGGVKTTKQGSAASEDNIESNGDPSKVMKRRSLIFGRRYKE